MPQGKTTEVPRPMTPSVRAAVARPFFGASGPRAVPFDAVRVRTALRRRDHGPTPPPARTLSGCLSQLRSVPRATQHVLMGDEQQSPDRRRAHDTRARLAV